jgi:hypothetical protein
MSKLYYSTVFWWPAILRLSIYSVLTAGGVLIVQLEKRNTADFVNYGWVEWTKFWWPVIAAWLGTKLAFLDNAMAKLREKHKSETEVWKAGETI